MRVSPSYAATSPVAGAWAKGTGVHIILGSPLIASTMLRPEVTAGLLPDLRQAVVADDRRTQSRITRRAEELDAKLAALAEKVTA